MSDTVEFYTTPNAMEPLFPEDASKTLEDLAIQLISKAGELSGKLHPITREAIAEFLRPMNSYYSNLIEGHDTHPIDIHNALKKNYSDDKEKKNLQFEAFAHINVHRKLSEKLKIHDTLINTASSDFLLKIHKEFYEYLPEEFKVVMSKEGKKIPVLPGKYRTTEVEVGRHIGPFSGNLNSFITRFEDFFDPTKDSNKSKINRIISIAASHHRLAWIHPFTDGNGRVVRLYSDACFMNENIDASGLWSISRGLARKKEEYWTRLANADQKRFNDYDGRGNLSNKMLIEFCEFFLLTAVDQAEYMSTVLNIDNICNRLEKFTDLMRIKNKLRAEAKFILIDVFLKGKISKTDAMRITNTSDKTLKKITDEMINLELLKSKKEGKEIMFYVNYPISFAASIFPGLYPESKELDLLNNT